jgi:hypothetical protein
VSRKKKRQGMHPGLAVVILLVCGGIAAKSLLPKAGPGPEGDDGSLSADAMVVDDEAAIDGVGSEAISVDLLAQHGSFAGRVALGLAFHVPADFVAAAPAGETQQYATPGRWGEEEPPSLQLGVVMISSGSRRALLGGRVVGVGDEVDGVEITAISVGLVTGRWQGHQLSYDLEQVVPREFRAEWARRHAAATDESTTTSGTAEVGAPAPKNKDTRK